MGKLIDIDDACNWWYWTLYSLFKFHDSEDSVVERFRKEMDKKAIGGYEIRRALQKDAPPLAKDFEYLKREAKGILVHNDHAIVKFTDRLIVLDNGKQFLLDFCQSWGSPITAEVKANLVVNLNGRWVIGYDFNLPEHLTIDYINQFFDYD